jgi:hypothetical protein
VATRHVLEGRVIMARQKRLIERQKRNGFDSSVSENLLRTFESSLATFQDDLAAIEAEG